MENKRNRFNALSLFSGAGLGETYFKEHGINVKVAAELLPERVKLYRHLYPEVKMFEGDISNEKILDEIIESAKESKCNFIVATPPCQGMSTAGKKEKDDPRNRLIIYVVKAIKEIKPEFVMIENVPAILKTKIKIDNKWILIDSYLERELGKEYYFNNNKIVNAMNYGVAQSRERCIYLLSKKTNNIRWEFPKPNERVITLRDAIGDLPSLDPDVTDISESERKKLFPDYEKKRKEGLKASKWHYPPKHKYRHVIAMMHTAEGNSAMDNTVYYPRLKNGKKSKGYKNTYKRQWWDRPAYTVTKYTSRIGSQENGHPGYAIVDSEKEELRLWSDPRVFSIFELMRVTSLPDDWNIPDGFSSNVLREVIGECVPPKLFESAIKELERLLDENN